MESRLIDGMESLSTWKLTNAGQAKAETYRKMGNDYVLLRNREWNYTVWEINLSRDKVTGFEVHYMLRATNPEPANPHGKPRADSRPAHGRSERHTIYPDSDLSKRKEAHP